MHCIKHFIYLWLLGYWFWDKFFLIGLFFPSHSIGDLSNFSFICYQHYNLASWQHSEIKQFPLFIYLSMCLSLSNLIYLSIHLYLSVYIFISIPLCPSICLRLHCCTVMFIRVGVPQSYLANIRVIPFTCSLNTNFCWLISTPFSIYTVVIHSSRVPWAQKNILPLFPFFWKECGMLQNTCVCIALWSLNWMTL